jgi:peptidoglycan-associated lipoprotein
MQVIVVAALALGVAACHKPSETKPSETTAAGSGATTTGVGEQGAGTGTAEAGTLTPQQQALAALKAKSVIYFTYDSSEIRAEDLDVVAAHAAYLTKYTTGRVRLEGHTDERGSREYNIGLGERRAQAVRRALMLHGVASAQIMTVSYGEERPAAQGSDESAYAQNRRVEIVHVP